MWSSWPLWRVGSIRCLVDSWDSTVQAYLSGASSSAIGSCKREWLVFFFLHGMAAPIRTSIFDGLFIFFIFRMNKIKSSRSPSVLEFVLLVRTFLLFSFLSGFADIGPDFKPHVSPRSRLNVCQSLPGLHISFGRFLFQQKKFCEPCPLMWQTSVLIDIPMIVNVFFLHDVQIGVIGPCYANIPQWNRECFFLLQTQSLHGLQRHLIVLSVEALPIRLEFFYWDLHSLRSVPALQWVSGFVVCPWPFCYTICYWQSKFFSLLWDQYFFCIDTSRIDLWCVHFLQVFQISDQNMSFPKFSPRSMHVQEILPVRLSCQIGQVWIDLLFKSGNIRPLLRTEWWVLCKVLRIVLHREFSHPPRGPGCFADRISIT